MTASRRRADPLLSLHRRGLLAPGDAPTNDVLLAAALRYRALAAAAEVGIRSADVGRVVVDGGCSPSVDQGAQARDNLTKADCAVGVRCLSVLRAVVVVETPIIDLRHLIPEVRDRNAANAVLMDRLTDALSRLADLWAVHGRKHSPLTSWRAA